MMNTENSARGGGGARGIWMKRRLEDVFLPSAAIVMLYEMGLAVGERSARQLIDQTGVEALGDEP